MWKRRAFLRKYKSDWNVFRFKCVCQRVKTAAKLRACEEKWAWLGVWIR